MNVKYEKTGRIHAAMDSDGGSRCPAFIPRNKRTLTHDPITCRQCQAITLPERMAVLEGRTAMFRAWLADGVACGETHLEPVLERFDEMMEEAESEHIPDPRIVKGVVVHLDGRSGVVRTDDDLASALERGEFVCEKPHGEPQPNFSYLCGFKWCRCSD